MKRILFYRTVTRASFGEHAITLLLPFFLFIEESLDFEERLCNNGPGQLSLSTDSLANGLLSLHVDAERTTLSVIGAHSAHNAGEEQLLVRRITLPDPSIRDVILIITR